MSLNEAQILRFARHILVRELGPSVQARLLAARVRILKLDAAGRSTALWLARSGVGEILIPADSSPAPKLDPAGLLWAEDEGRALHEAVSERLKAHGPFSRVVIEARQGVSFASEGSAQAPEGESGQRKHRELTKTSKREATSESAAYSGLVGSADSVESGDELGGEVLELESSGGPEAVLALIARLSGVGGRVNSSTSATQPGR